MEINLLFNFLSNSIFLYWTINPTVDNPMGVINGGLIDNGLYPLFG